MGSWPNLASLGLSAAPTRLESLESHGRMANFHAECHRNPSKTRFLLEESPVACGVDRPGRSGRDLDRLAGCVSSP